MSKIINFEEIEIKKDIEIKTKNESIIKLEKKVNELTITNNQEFGLSNDLLKKIKDIIKTAETYRKEIVTPINKQLKNINDSFKPITEKANKIKRILESKIIDYNKILEKKALEEAEKQRKIELEKLENEKKIKESVSSFLDDDEIVEKEIQSIDNEIEIKKEEPIKIKSSFNTEQSSTNIRKKWTYDIENEKIIPIEYCKPDHKKIMSAIDLGIRNIPGLKIYQYDIVSSRNAK